MPASAAAAGGLCSLPLRAREAQALDPEALEHLVLVANAIPAGRTGFRVDKNLHLPCAHLDILTDAALQLHGVEVLCCKIIRWGKSGKKSHGRNPEVRLKCGMDNGLMTVAV